MRVMIETGELYARVNGDRVSLIVHADQGNIELSLSPLAAHNLGVVLPGLAREAACADIASAVKEMQGPRTHG